MSKLSLDKREFPWSKMNPRQEDFVLYKPEFQGKYALCGSGGMGGGKTVALVRRAILNLIDSPVFGDCSGNVGVIGRYKEKDFMRTTMPELRKWLPRSWIKNQSKTEGWIELINESVLYTAHFDDVSPIVSLNLGFAAVDQMEEIPLEVFEELFFRRTRLKTMTRYDGYGNLIVPEYDDISGECISIDPRKASAALTNQHVFGVCNPKRCWIHNVFVKNNDYLKSKDASIQAKYNPRFVLINIPTTENVKYVPQDYIKAQREELSEREFKRFVEGTWDSWEGMIYLDFTDDLINETNIVPMPGWSIYIGIDHGGTGDDKSKLTGVTAVVFMCVEPRTGEYPRIHIFDELYLQKSTIEDTVKAIDGKLQQIKLQQKSHYPKSFENDEMLRVPVTAWRCDPNMQKNVADSYETILDRYIQYAQNRGFTMALAPGMNNIDWNIERISWLFRKGILRINPKCINTIDEHKSWEYGDNEKPKNQQRDHTVNAVQYGSSAIPIGFNQLAMPDKPKTISDTIFSHIEKDRLGDRFDSILGYN